MTFTTNGQGEPICIHCGKVVEDRGEWVDEDEQPCPIAGFHTPWLWPEPTTKLTAENVKAAAESVEFLLRYLHASRRGHTAAEQRWRRDEGTARFQDTNWNTLIYSMKVWADALEAEEAPRRERQRLQETTHEFVPGGMAGCCLLCGYAPYARCHTGKVRDPFCHGENGCTNPDHVGLHERNP